jgi:hypothetical protein
MSLLDLEALKNTTRKSDPYDYLVVENFIRPEVFAGVVRDYPPMTTTGSVPPSELDIKGAFAELLDEMNGPDFRALIEEKFALDLSAYPTMFTVRGHCHKGNGKIHTDTESKIITVLLYMNERWEADGGRLRILRSGDDLENYAEEVPPYGGTLLVFRRSEKSWHGHEPFEGPRRAIQMNWVTSDKVVDKEQRRHRFTQRLKKLNPFAAD